MANELAISASMSAVNAGAAVNSGSVSKLLDMTGTDMLSGTQLIGYASAEALTFGEITGAPGMLLVKNLDAANFVTLGLDSPITQVICKIRAGAFALFQPPSATIYAQANIADVSVFKVVTEV